MVFNYVGLKEISGSLIVLEGVENASYEEVVDIKLEMERTEKEELCKLKAIKLLFRFLRVRSLYLFQIHRLS